MATDNDNVIDIDGGKEGERRSEPKKEGEKGAEGGKDSKKAKQKKAALYAVLGVFGLIAAYLAYKYYENNIAGSGTAAGAAPADDSGGASGSGGGAPVTPPPPVEPEIVQGLAPVVNIFLPNGPPAKAPGKTTGHASGPKITTPTTFVKTAQKITTLAAKTATTPAIKVQKAVATPANLDITKAIGDEYKDAEATANAHGHTAAPIVHTVSLSGKGPAEEKVQAAAAAKAAPKAPTLSKFPGFPTKAPVPAKPAPKPAPKPVAHAAINKRPA